jgi:ribonuclease R
MKVVKSLDIREKIISLVENCEYKPLLFKEIADFLMVKDEEAAYFSSILSELEDEGTIVRTSKGKYVRPDMANMAVAKIQITERGFGFAIMENGKDDIFIPPECLNGAMSQDKILVKVRKVPREGKRPEGEVVKVLSRANSRIVGTFEKSKYFGFVIPDDKKISGDIFIPKSEFNGAIEGCKVVAEIINWADNRRSAEGKVVEILGLCGEPGLDILSIARAYNIEDKFPDEVSEQVKKIPQTVEKNEIEKRRDLRELKTVTIDGEDAKDLDDAVTIEKLPNGNYLLGVHIADVSHYVTEGSPLDLDAVKKGTSVYLIDRVIPMLPKELSNGICSLNAGVDRLAFSIMMEINQSGNVVNHEIFKSVIKVNERMTYTDVAKILLEHDQELIEKYSNHITDFNLMLELCNILKKKRHNRGSIDFDFPEVKILLDKNGRPIAVKKYEITIANQIIEEFMLVCNETAAERMFWANAPFVYRVHEKPDQEKIDTFNEFLHGLGYKIKGVAQLHPKSLQEVIEKIKGKNEEKIISTLMLRSLQQARYSHKNQGHFGLAAEYYCHFTSPIRRYPDLFIHRVINEMLESNFVLEEKRLQYLLKQAEESAKISTEREKNAEQAEREVDDLKKVEFMAERVGEVFEGNISSVTSFGFFVGLENTIEGLVRIDSIDDDFYNFDPKHYHLIGERTKRIFKIGDTVNVKLVKADIMAKKLDFMLEEETTEGYRRNRIKRRRY